MISKIQNPPQQKFTTFRVSAKKKKNNNNDDDELTCMLIWAKGTYFM